MYRIITVIALIFGMLAGGVLYTTGQSIPSLEDRVATLESFHGIDYSTPTATSTQSPPTATATATNTPVPSGYQLVFSLSSDRSNPVPLAGATVSGDIYVFITPEDPNTIDRVKFYLDGSLNQTENNPPWDYNGGSSSEANNWNTNNESDGQYEIRADIEFFSGPDQSITVTFTVANQGPPPPTNTPGPTPTPTNTPTPAPVANFELIPTYHSMSVYVPWTSGGNTLPVEYRVAGSPDWIQGHPLLVVSGDNEARGSLVGLQSNTTYEVRVGTQIETMTTWNESYPVDSGVTYEVFNDVDFQNALNIVNPGDTILVHAGVYAPIDINRSGTENAYIDIRNFPNETPRITVSGLGTLVSIEAQYIRFMGFELDGGHNAIRVNEPSEYVVIDSNLIHNMIHEGDTSGPITIGDSFSSQNDVAHITVQNNEVHAPPADPAQSAIYVKGSSGNHVIRYNNIFFSHPGRMGHGTDCIGGGPNFASHGSLHRDTDVYGNYCEGATDDAISADGGGMNVRIWDNVSTRTQTGLSIAPVIDGPVYYFRNITYLQEVHWIDKCLGVKTGENSGGTSYLYHNVWYSPNDQDCDGKIHGFANDGGGSTGDPYFVNNILEVTNRIYSKSCVEHADHNLLFTEGNSSPIFDACGHGESNLADWSAASGRDVNSIWGQATFNADYSLAPGSLGIDAGVVIPGFNSLDSAWPYLGSAPDIGAYENN